MLPSWELTLRAERKSPATLRSYTDGVNTYLRWAEENQHDTLSRASVQAWVADVLGGGAKAATARTRLKGLRRCTAWAAAEGELDDDPVTATRSPTVDRKVVQALSEDQLKRLIKACAGKSLADRRDEALVRLMAETGARAADVVGIQTADVDLRHRWKEARGSDDGLMAVAGWSSRTIIDRYAGAAAASRAADEARLLGLGDL